MSVYTKSLLLCPKKYSLYNSFTEILKTISGEVIGFDVNQKIGSRQLKFNSQVFRLPNIMRAKWDDHFLKKANEIIWEEYEKQQPDLVFVYNSEFLLPETCDRIKKRSKLVFFLGDSPYFTKMNNYFLNVLAYGDVILAPDTFWLQQMNILGYQKTSFFVPGIETDSYYKLSEAELKSFDQVKQTEILYVGISYTDTWGYKKALLMSKFTDLDLAIYGNRHWKKWFRFFPELEKHHIQSGFIDTKVLNAMYNKSKIAPIDGNPGILNGFHIRLLESLGAGSLPLVEYRKDIEDELLKGSGLQLPLIKDFNKANDMAKYFLKNENERADLVSKVSEYIKNEFSPAKNGQRLLQLLKE